MQGFKDGLSNGEIARQLVPPERVESFRRNICNFRNRQDEIHDQFAAEQAEARAQAEAEAKREADKELAAIKRHKSFLERNEEERDLIIQAAKACMFDSETKELLPSDQQDRANFARCMTVAAQLTAQIKPIGADAQPNQSQTMNINLSGYTDEELKKLEPAIAVIESILAGKGAETGAGPKASN